MIKVFCLLFHLCSPPPLPPWQADITIAVPCFGDNDSPAIAAAITEADAAWLVTAPLSDAAAASSEGATIELKLGDGICMLTEPITMTRRDVPITLSGGVISTKGQISAIFEIR